MKVYRCATFVVRRMYYQLISLIWSNGKNWKIGWWFNRMTRVISSFILELRNKSISRFFRDLELFQLTIVLIMRTTRSHVCGFECNLHSYNREIHTLRKQGARRTSIHAMLPLEKFVNLISISHFSSLLNRALRFWNLYLECLCIDWHAHLISDLFSFISHFELVHFNTFDLENSNDDADMGKFFGILVADWFAISDLFSVIWWFLCQDEAHFRNTTRSVVRGLLVHYSWCLCVAVSLLVRFSVKSLLVLPPSPFPSYLFPPLLFHVHLQIPLSDCPLQSLSLVTITHFVVSWTVCVSLIDVWLCFATRSSLCFLLFLNISHLCRSILSLLTCFLELCHSCHQLIDRKCREEKETGERKETTLSK